MVEEGSGAGAKSVAQQEQEAIAKGEEEALQASEVTHLMSGLATCSLLIQCIECGCLPGFKRLWDRLTRWMTQTSHPEANITMGTKVGLKAV